MRCPKCGANVPDGKSKCPYCFSPLSDQPSRSFSVASNKINNDAYQKRNETLSKLKNIGPVGIGPNEYKLIVAYNYFFNMHPNFVSKNINIQFQCMIQILSKFGVQLLELNDYCYNCLYILCIRYSFHIYKPQHDSNFLLLYNYFFRHNKYLHN